MPSALVTLLALLVFSCPLILRRMTDPFRRNHCFSIIYLRFFSFSLTSRCKDLLECLAPLLVGAFTQIQWSYFAMGANKLFGDFFATF